MPKMENTYYNENGFLCAWKDFNKTFCDVSTYHKWMFKLQISSIFNFDQAHQSLISGALGVNACRVRKASHRAGGRKDLKKATVWGLRLLKPLIFQAVAAAVACATSFESWCISPEEFPSTNLTTGFFGLYNEKIVAPRDVLERQILWKVISS